MFLSKFKKKNEQSYATNRYLQTKISTSRGSSVEEGVRSKKNKVKNHTNHHEKGCSNPEESNRVQTLIKRRVVFHLICHRAWYKDSAQKFTLNNTSSLVKKLLHLQKSCEDVVMLVGIATVK